MPRDFPSAFNTAALSRHAKPYLILEVQWTSGTKYYIDRPNTFDATGTRVPTVETAKVIEWGEISIDLKEQQVGAVDSITIKLDDHSLSVTNILKAANQQRRKVKVWRMFDADAVTWSAGAALMFQGTLKPYGWELESNTVTLEVENSATLFTKVVSHQASRAIFEDVAPEHEDRHLPIVWGNAYRVPAVCVVKPWILHTAEPIPSGTGSVVIDIDAHPDDLGIATGVATDVFIDGDLMSVTFQQSGTPDTVPSTMTLTGGTNIMAKASISYCFLTGTSRYGVIEPSSIWPASYRETLENLVPPGTVCDIYLQPVVGMTNPPGWNTPESVGTLDYGNPWPGVYKIRFADNSINADLSSGCTVQFHDSSSDRRAYQTGVEVRPKDQTHTYVANDLPSKAINGVEGFGDIKDAAGTGRKDFFVIGGTISDVLDGSVEVINASDPPYTYNLDDDTWNLGTGGSDDLGHNCTTITFEQAPRTINQNMESDDIWVTLQGCEDNRDSTGALITNPVLCLLEYIENPDLLGVDVADINVTSFSDAAGTSGVSGYRVGFAQIEPMDGLTILQEIARQCHCILFFDQDTISIAVLANSAGSSALTFNTNPAGTDNIIAETLSEVDSSVDDLVTHVLGRWRKYWDDKTGNKLVDVVRFNNNAANALGRRDAEVEIWIYYKRTDVETELDFWRTRWSKMYKHVKFSGLLEALKLLPSDWITLSYTDGDGNVIHSSRSLEVMATVDMGTECLVEIEARYAAFTY